MKNLVVTLIIAIAVMASFSQVQAQGIVIVPDPGEPIQISSGDLIDIGEVGNIIDEERKIYVRVEDGNSTDSKDKVHFKILNSDGQNVRSYNLKDGQGVEISIPEGASMHIIKATDADANLAIFIE